MYKIFVDLDGVLFAFSPTVEKYLGKTYSNSECWKLVNAYEGGWFRQLPLMPDAKELWEFVNSLGMPVKILTATGHNYEDVSRQKEDACQDKLGIHYSDVITVPSGLDKGEFARADRILIDDTEEVIKMWQQCGGIGILHTDTASTIEKLKNILHNR